MPVYDGSIPPSLLNNPTPGGQNVERRITEEMSKLERWLEPMFARLPHFPPSARETLVSVAPWFALIFGVLGLAALFSIGAFASLFSPLILLAGGFAGILVFVNILLGLIAAVLQVLAFKPLQDHRKSGWNFLFYGSVLSMLSGILGVLFMQNGIGGVLGPLIGFWILFEIRPAYRA